MCCLLIVCLFAECRNDASNTIDQAIDEKKPLAELPDTVKHSFDAIWSVEYDSVKGLNKAKQLRRLTEPRITAEKITEILNKQWPLIQIKYRFCSGDTLFVSIPESNYLTQQMGTSGAEEYMITATFSFTEVKGINYVSYDFIEGDHAVPGVYNRNSWTY